MIKEVEAHEARIHWTLIKKSEFNNKHKNRDGKLKTILSIWNFNHRRSPDGKLTKHKAWLCEHVEMQQWGVNYRENYAPVVNRISVRLLLAIAIIHEFTSI